MADPETNKQTVLAYYNMAFNERKPAEAAKKYGAAHYIQHNPLGPRRVRGVRPLRRGLHGALPRDGPGDQARRRRGRDGCEA